MENDGFQVSQMERIHPLKLPHLQKDSFHHSMTDEEASSLNSHTATGRELFHASHMEKLLSKSIIWMEKMLDRVTYLVRTVFLKDRHHCSWGLILRSRRKWKKLMAKSKREESWGKSHE